MYSLLLLAITVFVALSEIVDKRMSLETTDTPGVAMMEFEKNINEIKQKLSAESDSGKIKGLDNEVDTFRNKLVAVNSIVKNQVESTEKLSGAITSIGNSAVKLVDGIKNGKWQDMVVGVLGMVGGVAALTGPLGALLSSVLAVISTIFGLLGNSQKAEESQESMLKRVITEALDKAHAEELKADAEGLKKMMLSIRTSVNQFRESKIVTQSQANEMYTQVFTGLDFFGKLKYEISKFCDISIDDPPPENKFIVYREKADKCLLFLNLYSDLSVYRMGLIANMASLFSVVKLDETAENLVSLGKQERLLDKEILMFLYDPINNHRKRFCIAQYYAAPSKYETIMAYSNLLKTIPNEKIPSKDVVVCSGHALTGVCHKLDITNNSNHFKYNIEKWLKNGIESMYISDMFSIIGYSKEFYKGEIYGPFAGPTVISMIPRGDWKSIKIETAEIGSQKMVRVCQEKVFDVMGRCDQLGIGQYPDLKFYLKLFGDDVTATEAHFNRPRWQFSNGPCIFPFKHNNKEYNHCINDGDEYGRYWCDALINNVKTKGFCSPSEPMKALQINANAHVPCGLPYILSGILYANCDKNGECFDTGSETKKKCLIGQSYDEKIQSISIPDNVQVDIFSGTNFQGNRYTLYGPNLIDDFCQKTITKSMKILNHNKKVSDMVKICRGTSLSLQCEYLETDTNYANMDINGCSYSGEEDKKKKIRSMFVPDGIRVEMWTEANFGGMELGPYIGPLTLDAVEGVISAYSIESLKVIKVQKLQN